MLYPCLTLPGRCALAFSTLDMQSPMTLPLPPKNPGLPFFLSSLFIFRSAGLSSIQSTHSVPLKAWCPFPLTTKSLPLSCSPTTGSNLSHPLGLWLLLSHLPSGYFIYSHLFSSLNVDLQYCGVPPTFTIKKLNNSFLPQTLPSSKFKETPDTLNITAKEHLNFLPMPLCKFQQSVSSPPPFWILTKEAIRKPAVVKHSLSEGLKLRALGWRRMLNFKKSCACFSAVTSNTTQNVLHAWDNEKGKACRIMTLIPRSKTTAGNRKLAPHGLTSMLISSKDQLGAALFPVIPTTLNAGWCDIWMLHSISLL